MTGNTGNTDKNPLVVFTPSGKRGNFEVGTPVLEAARALGVDIDSVCGGRAICGRCQITLSEGEFAKHGIRSTTGSLSDFSSVEERYDQKRGMKKGRRLSCQSKILGDVVIDVPASSQVHKQVVRKRAEARDIKLNPVTRLYYLEVEEPDMHKASSDLERVLLALEEQWGVSNVSLDFPLLAKLQSVLRAGKWKITVAVHDRSFASIIAIWPGFHDQAYGLAIDVGSTTIAAHLCNLSSGEVVASSGLMNPQIRFGEDLMSRVSYVMMNPGGEKEMTAVVREALNELGQTAAQEAGVEVDEILEVVLVGNPVMHHLFLGLDPVELGGAPFALATGLPVSCPARELGLEFNAGAHAYVLPCIAGHVGADCAAVVLSEEPFLSDDIMLVVDVGTNAEIVLGNKDKLVACSSPTGPAFEGAQISCGQRAAPGAIERIRIDRDTLEPRFKVIGSDLWSNEDGFDEAIEQTGITGICGSGIIEVVAEMYLAGIIDTDGLVIGDRAKVSPRIRRDGRTFSYLVHDGEPVVAITQNDIRAIQLAKAALYAGIQLLMDELKIGSVDRIRLAGAFGSHIDVKYAMILGLIPDCDLANVHSAGNAAGTGARIALLNGDARKKIESVVRQIIKIETAVEPKFQEHFVDAMAIPHKRAPFTLLSRTVELPAARSTAPAQTGGKQRRRRRRSR
ncbi:Iron-sulfur cluster-binding protein [hydrothermal vent metagenome]|uniref:Iron-sulfur cluster-binding protein n=1 Tax=hydrothermal vent metagenome TaxID=652676 RepID=A0A3B0S7K8_9ZZZZ